MKLFNLFNLILLIIITSCSDKDSECIIDGVEVTVVNNEVSVFASVKTNTDIEQYNWKFSDGFSEASLNPWISHDFIQNGEGFVELQVDLVNGDICEHTTNFKVDSYMTNSDTCDINIVGWNLNCSQLEVEINIDGNPYDIDVWWDFGDGSLLTNGNKHASYKYKKKGIYELEVGYSNANGCSDSTTRIVQIDSLAQIVN